MNKILLTVKVKYENMTFIKRIEDDEMDFNRLKLDLIKQLDMRKNDFYFEDENGCLLLDNLKVKKALFPFFGCKIKGHEPMIRVILAGNEKK